MYFINGVMTKINIYKETGYYEGYSSCSKCWILYFDINPFQKFDNPDLDIVVSNDDYDCPLVWVFAEVNIFRFSATW